MSGFLLGFFTTVLVLASLFMILLVLLQRGAEGGSGSAFGGGAVESAFGGETNQVLTRLTVITAIVFFVVGLGLYLGQISAHKQNSKAAVELESIVAKADAQAAQQAKAAGDKKPEEAPRPGVETQRAMQMLANETDKAAGEIKTVATQTVEAADKAVKKASTLLK